jgi:hypothetical protein
MAAYKDIIIKKAIIGWDVKDASSNIIPISHALKEKLPQ